MRPCLMNLGWPSPSIMNHYTININRTRLTYHNMAQHGTYKEINFYGASQLMGNAMAQML